MAFKQLHTVISDIITSKRTTGNITAYTDNGDGTFTYYSANTLEIPCHITIDSQDVAVISADTASFTLAIETTETTWSENKPYFMHEKEIKAFQILTEKTKQQTYKYQKYPLVLLTHPFTRRNSRIGAYECDFRLTIINNTNKNWYSDERYDNNFDTVLNPILDDILDGMCESKNVVIANKRKIERDFIDNLYIAGNPLPDELDAIIVEFKNVVIAEDPCVTEAGTDRVNIATSIVGEGEINSNPVSLTNIKKNSIVSLNATADAGSRFVNWAIAGVTYLNRLVSFYATASSAAIATFIKQWQLTTSVSGNGTITPESGTYDDGATIAITATPDDEHELDRVDITDAGGLTQITSETFNWVIDSATSMVAYFQEILTAILDVFSQAPEFMTDGWYMPALIGDPIPIKRNCVKTDGIADYALVSDVYIVGQTSLNFTWHGQINSVADGLEKALLYTGGSAASLKGISIYKYNSTVRIKTASGTGATTRTFVCTYNVGGFNKINVQWDGLAASNLIVTVNDIQLVGQTANRDWTGNSSFPIALFKNSQANTNYFDNKTAYIALENSFEYTCDNTTGSALLDSSGLGNDATIYTSDEAAFWGQTISVAEPYSLSRGCSIVAGVVIPENQSNLGFDVNDNALQYPAGSGIIDGLKHLYTFPTDTDLNAVIPAGDYTFTQLDSLEESEYLIKTKPSAEVISRLVVKKKLNNDLITYNNNSTFNNLTKYSNA